MNWITFDFLTHIWNWPFLQLSLKKKKNTHGFHFCYFYIIDKLQSGAVMHGLPCSSLQYCFGAPADVSPEPAPHLSSEPCGTPPNVGTSSVVVTQPRAANLTVARHQPAISCISQHNTSKTNGTQSKEPAPVQQGFLHSERFTEEEVPQEESPIQQPKYPHIPRPSIIRPTQVQMMIFNMLE